MQAPTLLQRCASVLERGTALALALCFAQTAQAESTIDSSKVAFHVGEEAMVCGVIAEVRPFSKGMYLNMGGPYPHQHVTLLIWSSNENSFVTRFGALSHLAGQKTCARGRIESYKNSLQIKLVNPQFLRLMK